MIMLLFCVNLGCCVVSGARARDDLRGVVNNGGVLCRVEINGKVCHLVCHVRSEQRLGEHPQSSLGPDVTTAVLCRTRNKARGCVV